MQGHEDHAQPGQIGPYRIVEPLGEGGMAVVYLAEQTEPVSRRVALKILKPGMDSRQIVARFESERQALALLDHPNIAKIHDGGLADNGRPYFVMEWVDGQPITAFCDQRALSPDARVRLFTDVCRAVQHAHLKGLIHRDIKPSNILVCEVDGVAQAKVIDFGIAKATEVPSTDETRFETRIGQIVGTPQYMSPEQTGPADTDIDTRADVYSLGVVLYELLVGELPLDLSGVRDIALPAVIREKLPPTPSARFTALDSTRDEISAARSTSAHDLARMLKGDLDWIVMKAIEKDRARRYETANALAMDCERYLAHEPVLARPPSSGYLLQRFVRRNRAAVAAISIALLAVIGGGIAATVGYLRAVEAERTAHQEAESATQISDFLVGLFEVSDPSEARGNSVTAREVLDAAVEDIDTNLAEQPEVQASLKQTMANVYMKLGLFEDATALAESALELRRVNGGSPAELAGSLDVLGELRRELGESDAALALHSEAVTVWEQSGEPPGWEWIATLQRVGYAHYTASRLDDAQQAFLAARDMALSIQPPDPSVLAEINGNIGVIYSMLKNDELAIQYKREAAEAFEQLHGRVDPLTATAKQNLAWSLKRIGQFSAASSVYGESLDIYHELYGEQHPLIANTMNNMAMSELALGNYTEAAGLLENSRAMYQDLLGESHWQVATVMTNLGRVKVKMGELNEAEQLQRDALAMKQEVLDAGHPRIAIAEEALAGTLNRMQRFAEAEQLARQALGHFDDAYGGEHPRTAYASVILAGALLGQGRIDEAEERILANIEIIETNLGERSIEAQETLRTLVRLYDAKGDSDEALKYRQRLAVFENSAS